ncbi:MAG: hypothetical protein HY289_15085 [Planctomycetes bacterium]|nr:hypothetical protein [Planctomycetota bacterium]
MSRWLRLSLLACIPALFVFVALPGCNTKTDPSQQAKDDKKKDDQKTGGDGHLDFGPHGGPCAEWGNENFHAEFIVDAAAKQVTVYILGSDPTKHPDEEPAKITEVKLAFVGTKPLVQLTLKYDEKETVKKKGIAFTGTDDRFATPEKLKVEISGKVVDKPYQGTVDYKAPKKTASLFLTPGGIYTAADIKANGSTTAVEKFKGIKLKHIKELNPGDRFCPITGSKAHAEYAWVVNDHRYEFCCPPCVEDFIDWAHNDPEKIKKPSEYVHKPM